MAMPVCEGDWTTADSILAVVSGEMPPRLREVAALVGVAALEDASGLWMVSVA